MANEIGNNSSAFNQAQQQMLENLQTSNDTVTTTPANEDTVTTTTPANEDTVTTTTPVNENTVLYVVKDESSLQDFLSQSNIPPA